MIVNFVKKEDQTYKTKPRFHERRITNRGLCIWQMNKMLRGTGYKIQRLMDMYGSVNTSQLLLVPTGYKKVDLINPFTCYGYVRLYPVDNCIAKWERILNKLMNTPVNKDWIIDGFKKNVQKDFRTYDNRPDWKAINRVANNLWQYHYPKI
jgi:hypothetical protein|tara:strand:+ start:337 stop:789 length:453 start_codon:yes stop_codon:yes gene_type:complete